MSIIISETRIMETDYYFMVFYCELSKSYGCPRGDIT